MLEEDEPFLPPESPSLSSDMPHPILGRPDSESSCDGRRAVDSPNKAQGPRRLLQLQVSGHSERIPTSQQDCARPSRQDHIKATDLIQFSPSENTLWQCQPPSSLPPLNPDSPEGRAVIQRIRNYLNFPDATPLQILSIRSLPETLMSINDLSEFEKAVLSVAWKKEDEEAAKIIKAAKPHPNSFDGKFTIQRIKRSLQLPDSATMEDVFSVNVFPETCTNNDDVKSLIADVNSLLWRDEDKLSVKNLIGKAEAVITVNPANTSLLSTP
jgi:hypothetical protein